MGLIRLLLALSVLAGHAHSILGLTFVLGVIPVQSFYIISGFYMSLILSEKYTGRHDSYKLFITNRLLRLYPIYWVVLILTVLFNMTTYILMGAGGTFERYSIFFVNHEGTNVLSLLFLIITNTLMFFQDIVSFLGLNVTDGSIYFTSNYLAVAYPLYIFLFIPQAWTVGLELMFYLIAPFLVKRNILVLSILIITSLVLRLVLYHQGLNHDPWTYRFLPTELAFFLAGCLAYKFYSHTKNYNFNRIYLLIIFGFLVSYTLFFQFIPVSFTFKQWIYYVIVILSLPFIFILTKNNKIDRFIAELSYPIYISHIFIIELFQSMNFSKEGNYFGLIVAVVTIVVSFLLVNLVANRVDHIRQKRLLN